MKKQLRRAALTMLKGGGAFSLIKDSAWRKQRLLILCYHGISIEDEHEWRPFLYLTPEIFERRLEMLERGKYAVLPLGEALERLNPNGLPRSSVALTCDHGGYDFYRQAYPRLKRHGFPATVYLTTYYSPLQLPVFSSMCSYLLWKARNLGSIDLGEFGVGRPVDLGSSDIREAAAGQIVERADAQNITGEEKNQIAARLAHRLGIDYEELLQKRILQVMNRSEMAELDGQCVDLQLHTHRPRPPREEELFRKEIRDNRAYIASVVGGERKHFCYPSGSYRPGV